MARLPRPTGAAFVLGSLALAAGVVAPLLPVTAQPAAALTDTRSTLHVGLFREYTTVQSAVNAAASGDRIEIDPGTYVENVAIDGKYLTLVAELGRVTLKGATAGDGASPLAVTNQPWSPVAATVVSGLRIIDGDAGPGKGGGISVVGASPRIHGNLIEKNHAQEYGGGIAAMFGSSPIIYDNVIRGNTATRGGAGVFAVQNSSPVIVDNTITGNSTWGWMTADGKGGSSGGGIYLENVPGDPTVFSSPVVRGNTISGNFASFGGGGVMMRTGVDATIVDNDIAGNSAIYGGGIHVETAGSTVVIASNRVTDNTVESSADYAGSGFGGGIAIYDWSRVTVSDNVISRNVASNGGAGVSAAEYATVVVRGNLISENVADPDDHVPVADGGGLYVAHANVLAQNNVFLRNGADVGGGIALSDGAVATITHNTVVANTQSGSAGGALFVQSTTTSAEIVNNIVTRNQGYQIFEEVPRARLDNNLIVAPAATIAARGSGLYYSYSTNGIDSTDDVNASEVLNATGNLDLDPLFTAFLADDFSLTARSPAIGAAMQIELPETFAGDAPETDDTGPSDIGALAYTGDTGEPGDTRDSEG